MAKSTRTRLFVVLIGCASLWATCGKPFFTRYRAMEVEATERREAAQPP